MVPTVQVKPPKVLGRFEVGAKIGGGGMATVYLGRDVREDGTEAVVALKVIRDELVNDEQFTAMFVDEAKILARLSHPNVIQTLEYGVTGPHHFIAMELLNGRTVADVWDTLAAEKGTFDLGLAAWVCARVAEGLHSAHELVDEKHVPLSVIHRDVNPTNIFVTHGGEVKLIDFGLARARVRVSKSADGIVKGKIPYLAPEQARGAPIDRRVDIYALGTTLWEMSTMKRLFKRDNDIDTLKAIRDAHVPDPREENPDFPEALWKIIDRALQRDRDERYASAEELRADLDTFARSTGPHVQKLASLVSRLFPGGEARQEKWLRDAAAVRAKETMAPPAPVPMASSSHLEAHAGPPSVRTAAASNVSTSTPESEPAPISREATRRSSPVVADPPRAGRETETKSTRPTSEKASSPPPSRSSTKPAPRKSVRPDDGKKSKRPHDATRKKRKKQGDSTSREIAPQEDTRKLWMVVAAVVGGLLILALLASR